MTVRLAMDSTCDLPADLLRAYLTTVPIHIRLGTETSAQDVTIDPRDWSLTEYQMR